MYLYNDAAIVITLNTQPMHLTLSTNEQIIICQPFVQCVNRVCNQSVVSVVLFYYDSEQSRRVSNQREYCLWCLTRHTCVHFSLLIVFRHHSEHQRKIVYSSKKRTLKPIMYIQITCFFFFYCLNK